MHFLNVYSVIVKFKSIKHSLTHVQSTLITMAQYQSALEPTLSKKVLIAYLYFVQGIVLSLCGTLPLTYKTIPSYTILGYFSAATLPFSFKFITAPLIEKYSLLSYGRRKFWIVISMTVATLIIFFISLIAGDEQKQIPTATLLFLLTLCVSVQDISTDALGIKELRKPQLSSFLQSVFQQLGIVTGSLLLGQLTSQRFGQMLGFKHAIISTGGFLLYMIPLILLPTVWIHFGFKETCSEKEQSVLRLSLWQVITHYRHFILPKYRVCRQALMFVVMFQGFNFFSAGYTVQLINAKILSKEFIISLGNFSLVLILPLTYVISKYINKDNLKFSQRLLYFIRAVLIALVYFIDSENGNVAGVFLFLLQMLGSFNFYLNGIVMNSFEDSKFEGMSVTMMASMSNLGRNSSVHLSLIGQFGFRKCVQYSFGYTGVMILTLKNFQEWINKGKQEEEDYEQIPHEHND